MNARLDSHPSRARRKRTKHAASLAPRPVQKNQEPFASATFMGSLLFLSGACALVMQVAWMRELRLVFGASTAASAAVRELPNQRVRGKAKSPRASRQVLWMWLATLPSASG